MAKGIRHGRGNLQIHDAALLIGPVLRGEALKRTNHGGCGVFNCFPQEIKNKGFTYIQ